MTVHDQQIETLKQEIADLEIAITDFEQKTAQARYAVVYRQGALAVLISQVVEEQADNIAVSSLNESQSGPTGEAARRWGRPKVHTADS